ncbi:uncharacterized protein JN550_008686 [Neoarthrinium moseri]|uniref:uncharacterized protein n=1 Tax=Neoarthrinium moseri TaxID=1658444 RepID=UPI001FDE08D0|nr:uncharacterized protein JN550_008686 [Neoarthrinium moseri]KAI1864866.1 hypothetical protein JN550_008686 [Neoarthrinium moseri]
MQSESSQTLHKPPLGTLWTSWPFSLPPTWPPPSAPTTVAESTPIAPISSWTTTTASPPLASTTTAPSDDTGWTHHQKAGTVIGLVLGLFSLLVALWLGWHLVQKRWARQEALVEEEERGPGRRAAAGSRAAGT